MKTIKLFFTLCVLLLALSCGAAESSHDKSIEELLKVTGLSDSLLQATRKTMKTKISQTKGEFEKSVFECGLREMDLSFVLNYSMPVFKSFYNEKDAIKIIEFSQSNIGKHSIRNLLEFTITEQEFDAIVNKYDKKLSSILNAKSLLNAWIQTQYEGSQAGQKMAYECLNRPEVRKLMPPEVVDRLDKSN